jgi:transposase
MQYRAEYADYPRTGMALACLGGAYTMKEVANAFGVHYTTVGRIVKAYESNNSKLSNEHKNSGPGNGNGSLFGGIV